MEVEIEVDELPAADPSAQPEEAAVPLTFWGPLGKGIHLGFGPLGCAFCSTFYVSTPVLRSTPKYTGRDLGSNVHKRAFL